MSDVKGRFTGNMRFLIIVWLLHNVVPSGTAEMPKNLKEPLPTVKVATFRAPHSIPEANKEMTEVEEKEGEEKPEGKYKKKGEEKAKVEKKEKEEKAKVSENEEREDEGKNKEEKEEAQNKGKEEKGKKVKKEKDPLHPLAIVGLAIGGVVVVLGTVAAVEFMSTAYLQHPAPNSYGSLTNPSEADVEQGGFADEPPSAQESSAQAYYIRFVTIFVAAATGCMLYIWWEKIVWNSPYCTLLLKVLSGAAIFALCSLFFGVMRPLFDDCRSGQKLDFRHALKSAFSKTVVMVMSIYLIIVPFYADIVTDIQVLVYFNQEYKTRYYFWTNALAIVGSALVGAALLLKEHGFTCMSFLMAAASVFQFVPAIAFCIAVCTFLLTLDGTQLKCALVQTGVMGMLTSTSIIEGLLEALTSSEVQLHAMIHEEGWSNKTALRLSVAISILSLTNSLSKFDKKGQAVRFVENQAILGGTAEIASLEFVLTVICRLTGVISRMLLLTLFSEFMHQELDIFGAPLLAGIDLIVQVSLIAHSNGFQFTWRFLYAIPNVISPIEPLLVNNGPVMSTSIEKAACAHLTELIAAASIVLTVTGRNHIEEYFEQAGHSGNLEFARLWGISTLIHFPILGILRGCFALSSDTVADVTCFAMPAEADNFDKNSPAYVALMLQTNYSLNFVSNVSKQQDRRGLSNKDWTSIARALRSNCALENLELKFVDLGIKGCLELSAGLKQNTSLKTLDLSGTTDIGNEGGAAIAAALKRNRSLKTLRLRGSSVGSQFYIAIAEGLLRNNILEALDCESTKIDTEGAVVIAAVLKENTSLKSLNLIYTKIGNEGAVVIAEALEQNHTVRVSGIK